MCALFFETWIKRMVLWFCMVIRDVILIIDRYFCSPNKVNLAGCLVLALVCFKPFPRLIGPNYIYEWSYNHTGPRPLDHSQSGACRWSNGLAPMWMHPQWEWITLFYLYRYFSCPLSERWRSISKLSIRKQTGEWPAKIFNPKF